ncbi:hypothetical protein HNR46_000768 [Haloferula luteola]|uniref:Uncharacterized protein n=1 Tax=Haloferula luteola TaxID=595692 RepID=A0A840V9B1_9BACT|nr:hypothetical protein [Haloferula luteola]MBB5350540.1 hypothetical protein [Haloferula luteola]
MSRNHQETHDHEEAPILASKLTARPQANHTTVDPVRPMIGLDPAVIVSLTRITQPVLEQRRVLFSDGDPVAEALGMTESEKARLERSWAKVKDRVLVRQHEGLRSEQREDRLWFGVDPFDGDAIRRQFYQDAEDTLGSERAAAFLTCSRADEAFGKWGHEVSGAYSIRYESQSDGSLVYRITRQDSPDAPEGKSWITSQIPPHIRELTDPLGIKPDASAP